MTSPERHPWAVEVFEATRRGPEAVARAASRLGDDCSPEDVDAFARDVVDLLEQPEVEPHLAPLVAAVPVLAGPGAIARVGEVLRGEIAEWAVDPAMAVLERQRNAEATIQLLLCAREALRTDVLNRAAAGSRRSRYSPGDVHAAARADTPAPDLERYLAYTLESVLRQRTRFLAENLQRTLHTPAHRFLRQVIWVRYHGGAVDDAFVVDPDEPRLIDAEYEPIATPPTCLIGVAHPAELSAAQREAFGLLLADHELTGLFPQLDRLSVSAADDLEHMELDCQVNEAEFATFMARNGWVHDARRQRFVLRVRGSELHLSTERAGPRNRVLRSFSLAGPRIERQSREDDIIYSEARGAVSNVLANFAPDLM